MKLQVRVKIGRRIGVERWDDHQLYVNISKQPIDGAANKQLIEVMSDWLVVPKRAIQILRGQTARIKLVEVSLSEEELLAKLKKLSKNTDRPGKH